RSLDPAQASRELARPGGRALGLLLSASRYGGAGPAAEATASLKVTRHDQVKVLTAVADLAEIWTHVARDGMVLGRAHYLVKNNTEQFLRVALPAGARALDAFVSGTAVAPASGSDGALMI